MGRFTAWMASRRKTLRRQAKGAGGGRAARSLGFERCEQRIALSTNAGYEPIHLSIEGSDGSEGGFIVLTNGAGVTLSTWRANFVLAFNASDSADQWSWTNAYDSTIPFNTEATPIVAANGLNFALNPSLLGANIQIRTNSAWIGSNDTFADLDLAGFGDAGILITESNVVPIPPPSSGSHGNEGGQISMIPFIGPSMFALPTANESQLAVRTRQALGAEQLESAPAADSGRADSLRGKAVVYEVAHARPLQPAPEEVALKRAHLKNTADEAGSFEDFETAESRRDATSQTSAARSASLAFEVSDERNSARKPMISADRAATEAIFVRASLDDQRDAADGEAGEESAASRMAIAHDAVFDQLEQELEPLEEQREAAVATADAHERRIAGGVLIAVAAVPVLKTIRRKGQQAVEVRPRRSFHAG